MARRLSIVIFLIVLGGAALYFWNKGASSSVITANTEASTTLSSAKDHESTSTATVAVESSEKTQTTEIASNQEPAQMVPRSRRLPKSERDSIKLNTQNAEFSESPLFADSDWKIWNGVRAVPKNAGPPSAVVVGEMTGFYLVKEEAADPSAFSASQPIVVYDARLGIAGVVTGTFSVVLKEGVSPQVLTQNLGLKVLNSFPDIRTYYVTSPQEPFDLKVVQDILKNDPSLESSEMEILSRTYEKN
ncbi:hypothetical protein AZI85_10960 [Bdellovibrio bacteriovorus]|uniref:Uncharacterized protein n=1 Tax=Bdellovibrio bacteriovorus TaxID=959 RepID=A0A150WC97_BDEBC|nr:lipase chaperone [Bdellovibrio bacteriovorus]KYG60529.1 hypothetical protein AZI85_10960 [Bdellovibrio bacteriovorus]